MKLLITGGAGFIGSTVVKHLVFDLDLEVVNVDKNIEFKNNKIFYSYKKNNSVVKTSGNIKLSEKFEDYSSEINHNYKKKITNVDVDINLNDSNIYFDNINSQIKKRII